MKLLVVLVGLSSAVMAVMIFQAVRQEMDLRNLKTRMVKKSAEARKKEAAMIEVKDKIKDLKTALSSINIKMDELKKTKAGAEKSAQDLAKILQTCDTDKATAKKKETDVREAMNKLKRDHGEAKKAAEADIQHLKQQILDRDKAICVFADTTNEEARRLCGIAEVPK
ncbi:uncharacterized protein [Pempheris klunzingeri]|uniref:uncharacterized protein n=1 Tax=Pempheris klunzingeri TaxID=3127111 RepID=UPI0039809D0E